MCLPCTIATVIAGLWVTLAVTANPHIPEPRAYHPALISGLPTAYTAAPTPAATAFKSYYEGFEPTQTTAQPQPIISDPVTGKIFPLNLTNPHSIQTNDTQDPILYPLAWFTNSSLTASYGVSIISTILASNTTTNCTKCIDSLVVAQQVARANPEAVEELVIDLCMKYNYASAATCRNSYSKYALAPIFAQVLVNGNMSSYDGQLLCANQISPAYCSQPPALPLNMTGWFAKSKPANATAMVPKANGNRVKVLHASDLHIDPRYDTGSEASCASASSNITSPAPQFGAFKCDSPYSLILAALGAIPELTGTKKTGFDFTLYTGDLVSHDTNNQLSRDYILYTEDVLYRLMKEYLGAGPTYAAIGNHDEHIQATAWAHAITTGNATTLADTKSYNYDHLSSLWEHEGWISEQVANVSKSHYGAYSTLTPKGLKIITLNTDFWYKSNWLNFINATNPDLSGMLRWMTDELQDAEDKGQRVWIVGHVLSGWDGTNPLTNPTNLFYQIVTRYSPHVIANTFFGHTHEDFFSIFYNNNATSQTAENAVATSWIGPSLTPLTNLNAGFRMYEVDTGDWNIYEAHTWYSNVSTFASLTNTGPVFSYEYSTRDTYAINSTWPADAPLNATFWHTVTESMQKDPSLIHKLNTYQGKSSAMTPKLAPCNTTDCYTQKVCYMRSGSVAIARQNCKTGYGSVQS